VLGIKGTTKFQDQESIEEEEEFRQQNRGGEPMPQSMKDELNSLSGNSGGFNDPDINPTSSSSDDDDTLSYFAALAAD